MRIIDRKDVRVGDWIYPLSDAPVRSDVSWPQQVTYVYTTAVGDQLRVKFDESSWTHSDAPASFFVITRRDTDEDVAIL